MNTISTLQGQNTSLIKQSTRVLSAITLLTISAFSSAYSLEKPSASNTGPTTCKCELTQYNGPTKITQDGTIIEGVIISDTLRIDANNVTIRNFVLENDNHFGIQVINDSENVVIEDGEIQGTLSAAIFGSNYTARRLEIHNTRADAFKGKDNFVIENNWIYDLGSTVGSHSDGVQVSGGSDGIIRGNFFDMPASNIDFTNSQCIIIKSDSGPIDNILIEGNWINGGGYSVQVRDGDSTHGLPTGTSVIDNRFGRDYEFGPWVFDDDYFVMLNVWDDTGEAIANQ